MADKEEWEECAGKKGEAREVEEEEAKWVLEEDVKVGVAVV